MAIGKEDNQDKAVQSTATNQNIFAAAAAAQTAGQKNAESNILSILSLDTSGPIYGVMSSEQVSKFAEKFEEAIKQSNPANYRFKVVRIDRDKYGTYASAIVLTGVAVNNQNAGVVVYTMMLGGSVEPAQPVRETHGSATIIRQTVVSDSYDEDFRRIQRTAVNELLGVNADSKIYSAGVCVIPSHFDPENKEMMSRLIHNASFAMVTEFRRRSGDGTSLVLSKSKENSVMQVTASYGNKQTTDAVGLPQRADVQLTFAETQQQKNNQSLNNRGGQTSRFGSISGFVDLIYNPVNANQNYNPMWGMPAMQQRAPQYSPMFVIRSIKNERAGTLEGQMAMLLALAALVDNNEWVNTFVSRWQNSRRDENRNRINLSDIGALNIEANLPINGQVQTGAYGKPIDTREDGFDQTALVTLINAMVNQGLYFAIDMPICGAESWYMDPFLAAASGNAVNGKNASSAEMLEIIDKMTVGYFSRRLRESGIQLNQFFIGRPIPYHMGYYRDNAGVMRDLADVDLLAVLNSQGTSDPTIGQRWSSTWVPGYFPEPLQLTQRKEIIDSVVGAGNVVQTGWGIRAFINPAVISALAATAGDIGFQMSFVSPFNNYNAMGGRPTFDFTSFAQGLRNGSIGNAFVYQNFGNFGNQNTGGYNFFNSHVR